jgi:hypothetical protein
MRKQYWLAGAPLLALALTAQAVTAAGIQQDDGWLAWVGCWKPDGDTSDTRLCVVPSGAGVRMVTLVAGKVETESRLIADGQLHPIDQEGCKGTERALWSQDRQRVFVRSDLTCGTTITRKVTGVFALLSAKEWVSVQGVTSGSTTGTRMVRYVEAQATNVPADIAQALQSNRLARETARYSATSLLDLNDVREALANVDARVVEDWLTTVAQPFDLDGRKLMELADAGVPGSTIDVLVAVSNPDHFAVNDRIDEEDYFREPRRRGGVSCWDASYAGYAYDPFGYRYGGYGYGCYPTGGYSPWGYGGYGWRYTPVIVVDRGKVGRGGKVTKGGYSKGGSSGSTAKTKDGSASQPSKTSAGSGSKTSTSGSATSGSGSDSGKAKKKD